MSLVDFAEVMALRFRLENRHFPTFLPILKIYRVCFLILNADSIFTYFLHFLFLNYRFCMEISKFSANTNLGFGNFSLFAAGAGEVCGGWGEGDAQKSTSSPSGVEQRKNMKLRLCEHSTVHKTKFNLN